MDSSPVTTERSPPPRRTRLLVKVVVLAPAALLLLIIIATGISIVRMSRTRAADLLSAKQARLLEDGGTSFEVEQRGGHAGLAIEDRFVSLAPEPGERLVYFFGASSLVVPTPATAFPALLEHRLNAEHPGGYRVANFGIRGLTTFSIRNQVAASLQVGHPDLIMFYEGHNDYGRIYREVLQQEYGLISGNPVLNALTAAVLMPARFHDYTHYRYVLGTSIDPALLSVLQQLGLVHPDSELVPLMDALALECFSRNIETILDAARLHDIPVVLITPISNLEMEPYGVDDTARSTWRRGLAEPLPQPRLAELRRARDLDAFNFSIRAKTPLVEFVRAQAGPGVRVLDLEKELEAIGFRFGKGDFLDELHFKPETHALVAGLLDRYLHEEHLLGLEPSEVQKPQAEQAPARPAH